MCRAALHEPRGVGTVETMERLATRLGSLALRNPMAVEMTSAVLQGGFAALAGARQELADWLMVKNLVLRDIVGIAADSLGSYAEREERPGHWRNFVPPETRGGAR
jgi:hypothetical protein